MNHQRLAARFSHYVALGGLACCAAFGLARRSGADALPGRYVTKLGAVYDTKTKLIWQQAPAPTTATFSEAEQYCISVSSKTVTWRVPGVKELETLVDETRSNPAIDPTAFPSTPADYFWTSSPVTSFPMSAWSVDFRRGLDNFFDVTSQHYVRCVH
jgi:hypothetical protein